MRLSDGLLIVTAVMISSTFFRRRVALQRMARYQNDRLGYLGERAVGEALLPLMADG